jgi:hypothetical protein
MDWLIGLQVVAPLFIFMFVGYILKKTHLVRPSFIEGLNKFSYRFTIPVVVFFNIYQADFSTFDMDLLWFTLVVSVVLMSALALIMHFSIRDTKKKGAVIQGFVRINQVLFAIPLLQNMYGDASAGVAAVLTSLMIPVSNIIAVSILTYYKNNGKISWKIILLGIIKNPFIIATLIGLAFSLFKFWVPAVETYTPAILVDTLATITAFATPLALIALGADISFSKQEIFYDIKLTVLIAAIRLVVIPGVIVGLGIWYGFRGVELGGLLVVLGSPSAVSGYQMAMQLNADAKLARQAIIFTSLLSLLTLSFFITLLFNLNLL